MYTPFKMKGKSPMMKALVGKQNNLPAELKAKIEASPATMKKESAMKMKKESSMKMMKKSPAKANQYGPKSTGTKTYDQAYDALSEEKKASYRNKTGDKGSGRKAFKTAASTYNKDTYKTDNPTKVAKSRKMDKKTLAKDVKAQKSYDANDKARTKAASKNTANNSVKIKAKSDKIKAGNKTAKTKKRTKVGKLATRIANKFRKNKVDPNRTATKVEKNKTKLAKSREKAMNKDSKKQARENK